VDIDELVVSSDGSSVFTQAENSPTGCVHFPGRWISNARHHPLPSDRQPVRHRDFYYTDLKIPSTCPNKWCVVPAKCALRDQWSVHRVTGRPSLETFSETIVYRHFRGISNNWKLKRAFEVKFVPDRHEKDNLLLQTFRRIRWDEGQMQ
jgi:hypothetical protein